MNDSDRRRLKCLQSVFVDTHLRDTIEDASGCAIPLIVCAAFRSALAWVAYQNNQHALKNEDTFHKINQYLQIDFLRSLFDPEMKK